MTKQVRPDMMWCVLYALVSKTLYTAAQSAAEWCCDAIPPSIELLGPPPRPPWLPYALSCNGSRVAQTTIKVEPASTWTASEDNATRDATTLEPGASQAPGTAETHQVVEAIYTTSAEAGSSKFTRNDRKINATEPARGTATQDSTSLTTGNVTTLEPGADQARGTRGSGLSPPVVFLTVLAGLFIFFICLFMFLRWYKRKHISIKVAPEKHPENYLYNYHVRGKQWRRVESESDGSVSDFTNSSQKSLIACNAFLVGDRSLSLRQSRKNLYLANSSKKLKDGALETAQACQENIEMEPAFNFSDLQGDGSTSSGIGLSQTDLHDLDTGQDDPVEEPRPTALWAITRAPPDGEAEMPPENYSDTETPREKHTKTAIVRPMVKSGSTPISQIFSPVKSEHEPKKRKTAEEKLSPDETLPGMYRSPRSLDPLPAKVPEKKPRTKKRKRAKPRASKSGDDFCETAVTIPDLYPEEDV